MSYDTAASEARQAATWAMSAASQTTDQAVINLSVAVQHLAKSVGEIARELKSDQ